MLASSAEPAICARLRGCGPDALAHERNLVRAPVWGSDLLVAPVSLYGAPVRQVTGGALTLADQRMYAELTTAYVRDGCPDDGHVDFSLGEAARLLHGRGVVGGKQRRAVREAIHRLRVVGYESLLRMNDGSEVLDGWGLLTDKYKLVLSGRSNSRVHLSSVMAGLLSEGSAVLLSRSVWTAITRGDVLSGRLWSFLAGERLPAPGRRPWPYALADIQGVLGLTWRRRDRVAVRVAAACRVIERCDPRYRLTVIPSSTARGGYRVEANRSAHDRNEAIEPRWPRIVRTAWHRAAGPRQPSSPQRVVLEAWAERYGPGWVAAQMVGPDPYWDVREAVAVKERAIEAAEVDYEHRKADSALGLELVWDTLRRQGLVGADAVGALQ